MAMRNVRMKHLLGIFLFVAAAVSSVVHKPSVASFGSFVKQPNPVLVTFCKSSCGFCKALSPEFEAAAVSLEHTNVALAWIDCTLERNICRSSNVSYYPTLKVFRDGEHQEYFGPKKTKAIASYMARQVMPSLSILRSAAALEDFKALDDVAVVASVHVDDETRKTVFSNVAAKLKDKFLFGLVPREDAGPPTIALYKHFDNGRDVFEETFTEENIARFIAASSKPLIAELTSETYKSYMAEEIPLAYIFAETETERYELSQSLYPLARKYKGIVNFATVDAQIYGEHAINLNLDIGKWPAFAVEDMTNNGKFPYKEQGEGALEVEVMSRFVENILAGKIPPSLRSEPVPEQHGPVTTVVADNYQDMVINNDEDVLLLIYSPQCKHSSAFRPVYGELAALYGEQFNKLRVAQIDAIANDVPGKVQGFPTIRLFAARQKTKPLEYVGPRTIQSLSEFIRRNGSHHIDLAAKTVGDNGEYSDKSLIESLRRHQKMKDTIVQQAWKMAQKLEILFSEALETMFKGSKVEEIREL